MFLRPLNDKQKELFLGLAQQAASANDVIEESEKALLDAYADEMGIAPDAGSNLPLEDILNELRKISSPRELSQITLEIVGMLMSDMEYDNAEKEFMDKLKAAWGIEQKKIDEMFEVIRDYMNLMKKINLLVFE